MYYSNTQIRIPTKVLLSCYIGIHIISLISILQLLG